MGAKSSKTDDYRPPTEAEKRHLGPYIDQVRRLFPQKYNTIQKTDVFENRQLVENARKLMRETEGVSITRSSWTNGQPQARNTHDNATSKAPQRVSQSSAIRATGKKATPSSSTCWTCHGRLCETKKNPSVKQRQGSVTVTDQEVDQLASFYQTLARDPHPQSHQTSQQRRPPPAPPRPPSTTTGTGAAGVGIQEDEEEMKEVRDGERNANGTCTRKATSTGGAAVACVSSTAGSPQVTHGTATTTRPAEAPTQTANSIQTSENEDENLQSAMRDVRYRDVVIVSHPGEQTSGRELVVGAEVQEKAKQERSRAQTSYGPDHDHHPDNATLSEAKFWVLDHSRRVHDVRSKYCILKKPLGRGHFGTVYPAYNRKTGEPAAVKCVPKTDPRQLEMLKSEIQVLEGAYHPYIIQLKDVYEDPQNIYIAMEYCKGGELFDRIQESGYYREHSASMRFREMLLAIHYLHKRHIVHRDLKPENFLMDSQDEDASIKMIDFGLAVTLQRGQTLTSRVGTPYYIAPEVLRKRYDHSCDVWSLGVILYVLLCGYPPFLGEKDIDIYKKVLNGDFDFDGPEWVFVSQEPRDLITKLLKLDPSERIKIPDALSHKWIVHEGLTDTISLPESFYLSLKGFCSISNMKRISLYWISSHMSKKLLYSFQELFCSFKRGKKEPLDMDDLQELFVNQGCYLSPSEMKFIIKKLRECGIHSIGVREFTAIFMRKPIYLNQYVLTKLQDWWDHNDSGGMELDDFIVAIARVYRVDESIQKKMLKAYRNLRKLLERHPQRVSTATNETDGYVRVPADWKRGYVLVKEREIEFQIGKHVQEKDVSLAGAIFRQAVETLSEADLGHRGYVGMKTFLRIVGTRA